MYEKIRAKYGAQHTLRSDPRARTLAEERGHAQSARADEWEERGAQTLPAQLPQLRQSTHPKVAARPAAKVAARPAGRGKFKLGTLFLNW